MCNNKKEEDRIEAYLKQLIHKYGIEEKERQAELNYYNGTKQFYFEQCVRKGK